MADYAHHVHQALAHTHKEKEHYKKKWEGIKESLGSKVESVGTLLEVSAGAFVGGLAEGRLDQPTFMHIPLNLLGGIVATGLGVAGAAGRASSHLTNFGTGLVSSYAASAGFKFGNTWRGTGSLGVALKGAAKPPAALPAVPVAAPAVGNYPPEVMAGIAAQMGQR